MLPCLIDYMGCDGSLQDTSLWSRTLSSNRKPPVPHQAYYCLLGHLYAAARLELMRMGQTLNLSQYTPAGPAHGNVSSHKSFHPTELGCNKSAMLCSLTEHTTHS